MQTDEELKLINELVNSGLEECSCVLFVGPEFIKFDGKDYNIAFYETIPDSDENNIDRTKVKYNPFEKVWSFSSTQNRRKWLNKFSDFFKHQRKLDDPIFHKLASIPFHLIVSLIPDDTLYAAFSQYKNFDVDFKCFFIDSSVPEPTKDRMLIYNIYGNIQNREYVASHSDYITFIKKFIEESTSLGNLKSAIKKANYLVFIGFEFDKWYNTFLLYILTNVLETQNDKYAIEEQNPEKLVKKLLDREELNMMFIDGNVEQFVDHLYNKAKENKCLRELVFEEEFLRNTIRAIQEAIVKTQERIDVVDPRERRKLVLDLDILLKDKEDMTKRLIALNK